MCALVLSVYLCCIVIDRQNVHSTEIEILRSIRRVDNGDVKCTLVAWSVAASLESARRPHYAPPIIRYEIILQTRRARDTHITLCAAYRMYLYCFIVIGKLYGS